MSKAGVQDRYIDAFRKAGIKILSKKMFIMIIMLLNKIVGLIAVIILFSGNANAATLTVNASGGADYTGIQEAIDNATTGDTIEVYSGTYFENVIINKQLTLLGIGMPVVHAPVVHAIRIGSSITIAANGTRLEGFTATWSDGFMEAGIMVTSNGNTLIGNNASNNYNGILLRNPGGSNNILIDNNAFDNHYGIHLYVSGNNNTLIGNNVSSIYHGIYDGIYLTSSSYNTLIGNNASNNLCGIVLYISSNNNTLSGNNASNNNDGICLEYSSDNNTLFGNKLSNNEIGIYQITVHNNTIYNNFFNNTKNIHFVYDLFIDDPFYINTWNVIKQSGTNIIGGYYLGGNFWANPSGTGFSQTCMDSDGDGICDSSYSLDGNNSDYLPLAYKAKTEIRGDVNRNSILDTGDATLILRYLVELPTPSEYLPILPIGDMNCNEMLDTGDATLILRDIVGLDIPRCWG